MLTAKEKIGRGLDLLAVGLREFVDQHMGSTVPGKDWVELLEARDELRNGKVQRYSAQDPRFLLRILTEEWRSFGDDLSHEQRALATELREAGNRWAHVPAISDDDAQRALDTMERLLGSVGAADVAAQVRAIRRGAATHDPADALPPSAPETQGPRERSPGSAHVSAGDLPPGLKRIVILGPSVTAELAFHEAINYALVHNSVSPLFGLILANTGSTPITISSIEITMEAPLPDPVAPAQNYPGFTLEPGEHAGLTGGLLKWPLSATAFARIDESVTAQIHLVINTPQGRLHGEESVRLLARDEWWNNSIPESLAAFVAPGNPAVKELISEASTLLVERTGDPSLPGYQAGSERVLAMAEAIYDAMRRRGIRYIDPPPSFEDTGQKIRSHREVLEDRWGTCLDLACVYAAALEAAGLNPVTVLCDGHAFAGVLVDDVQLPEVALQDANTIVNLIDSGLLIPVETTKLTAGPGNTDFRGAVQAARPRFTAGLSGIQNVLDIRRAHRRVRPLPSILSNDGAQIIEVERVPRQQISLPRHVDRPEPVAPSAHAGTYVAQTFPPRIVQWRNSLLDLSFRNPLLNMKTGRSGLDLHVPAGALGGLEDLIAAGQLLTLLPNDKLDSIHLAAGARTAQDIEPEQLTDMLMQEGLLFTSCTEAAYPARLKAMVRKARTVIEETGANNLFLALGSMLWEDNGREARAPLFLVPVSLRSRRGRPYQVQIEDGAYAIPNQCLLEKLRVSRGLEVPSFQNPELDGSGIDLADSLQQIRIALVRSGLKFRVEETAHLAILQFSTLQMWQDLGENWETFLKNPVVRHLVETPTDSFVDPVSEPAFDARAEAEAYLPIAIDGSQLEAVRWAAAGRSFVLEGPPGTGKSQTITNLIANSLAEGRRVLFVAEKQAALDVVRRRLDAVGLGAFCLDLHGKTQTPAAVRDQLRTALNATTTSNPSSWAALRSNYQALVANLTRYPQALHDVGSAGLSAWTARQVILTHGGHDALLAATCEVPESVVAAGSNVEQLYSTARELGEALQDLGAPLAAHVWGLAGSGGAEGVDRARIREALTALVGAESAVSDPAARALAESSRGAAELTIAADWLDRALEGTAVPSGVARTVVQGDWLERAHAAESSLARHQVEAGSLMAVFEPSILSADLDRLTSASVEADGKLFKKKRRLAVLGELGLHLLPGATVALDQLTASLRQAADLRSTSVQLDAYLAAVPGVRLPAGWNPVSSGATAVLAGQLSGIYSSYLLAAQLPAAVPAADQLVTSRPAAAYPLFGAEPGAPTAAPVGAGPGGNSIRDLAGACVSWFDALGATEQDIERWRAGRNLIAAIRDSVPAWLADAAGNAFVGLSRWGAVQGHLRLLDSAGLGDFVAAVRAATIPAPELEPVLRSAVARAALRERLVTAGLEGFDAVQRQRLIDRYLETGIDVRKQMVSELPARIVQARTFQTSRMVGRVGELSRELSRKRGGLGIRGLLSTYGSVIGEITPCLMMSPHSVARFLAPGAVDVDLVVYDEASQIRVAEAIGAMGRARSVVVVGDSKQMPPTSFGSAGENDDDDLESPVLGAIAVPSDRESILSESVESNLPQLWLSWHYRSQDESLIAFSNRYYYEGRLASFPGPPEKRSGMGVEWRRVNGTFERGKGRVNRVEAAAMVNDIRARLRADATTSIGVVTFNTEQRNLMLDLLEASEDPAIADALAADDDPLFVKNLENVQGDERDVILFSLAFSPDPLTGKLPLNFGPLIRSGGERRLNVAITRARRQVVLYSSFDPEHIELARARSDGLIHLRDYLTLASRGTDGVSAMRTSSVHDLHREDIAEALVQAGLEVKSEIGLSDFTVDLAVRRDLATPWVAILLDGPGWAQRKTVSDRDAVPTTVLRGSMGWSRVERVWLPSWLARRADVIARILSAVEAAGALPPVDPAGRVVAVALGAVETSRSTGPTTSGASGSRATGEVVGLGSAEVGPVIRSAAPVVQDVLDLETGHLEFVPAHDTPDAGPRELLDRLQERRVAEYVRSVAMNVIAVESPIEATRLARIVGRRFGLQRVVEQRSNSILAVVPSALFRSTPLGSFVWAEGASPSSYSGFRSTPAGSDRAIHEIAPEELANAMHDVAKIGHGVTRDELIRETALVFGLHRLADKARKRLEQGLEWSIGQGKLREESDRIYES